MTQCPFKEKVDNSKVGGDKKAPSPKKPRAPKVDSFVAQSVEISESTVVVTLPLKIANEGNCFENYHIKNARHKNQKSVIKAGLTTAIKTIKLPCTITSTRFSPRLLDGHDNLNYSFKWTTDAIADCLIPGLKPGRADGDPRLSWKFDQVKSSDYGIKITFEF